MSNGLALYAKLELRAMTKSHLIRERAVMISSTMPSAKYSCSGSPLMFWNGITASEGLSGSGSPLLASTIAAAGTRVTGAVKR